MVASMSGSALRFSGSFTPGRYLTFSCWVLMISLSLVPKPPAGRVTTEPLPPPLAKSCMPYMSCSVRTISSKICIFTSDTHSFVCAVFSATNIATVLPQEPLPTAAARQGLPSIGVTADRSSPCFTIARPGAGSATPSTACGRRSARCVNNAAPAVAWASSQARRRGRTPATCVRPATATGRLWASPAIPSKTVLCRLGWGSGPKSEHLQNSNSGGASKT
mmetsp:Transcript_14519/g.43324  ORF Transcript_14519/g.43324 Transcript_14519/m.43324 type:complete len:220 (+) Transcript_14519:1063-1722(+)